MNRPRNVTARQTTRFTIPGVGGVFKNNQGKVLCSILAVLQVVYALFGFWESDEHCFVGRFSFGRQMVPEARNIFSETEDLEHNFLREVQAVRYAVRIAVDRCLSAARLVRTSLNTQKVRGYGS